MQDEPLVIRIDREIRLRKHRFRHGETRLPILFPAGIAALLQIPAQPQQALRGNGRRRELSTGSKSFSICAGRFR